MGCALAAVSRGITFTPETDDVVDALFLLDLAIGDLEENHAQ